MAHATFLLVLASACLAGLAACVLCRALGAQGRRSSAVRRVGGYELERRIGRGGMGDVWRARDQRSARPVAVKLVRPADELLDAITDEVAVRRFEREAEVTAMLKSPHTVELYDFGVTEGGAPYYVMELLDGSDLEELVEREGPLEPLRVVHVLKQVLDALAEAHAHGLVHRDIKPANIHLCRRGSRDDFVKVLDFGLVTRQGPGWDARLTAQNRIVGTPAYLAPEVITGDREVDARADLYALGCVAYYLLTGKRVFAGPTPMQMAISHVIEQPAPPSRRIARKIPVALETIVLGCLEKRPEDRPDSATALLRMLDAIGSEEAASPCLAA